MITQYDSVEPAAIPVDAPAVAGYVDGIFGPNHAQFGQTGWDQAAWDRFSTPIKVRIAVNPNTNDGHVADVESGDLTPTTAPGWARMRLQTTGWDAIGLYVNRGNWDATRVACAGLPIRWWVATLDGTQTVPGALAVQYAGSDRSGGHFDLSLVDPQFYGGWFMGVLGPDDLQAIKGLLDAGSGTGQPDWAHTNQALLSTVQQNQNLLNDLETKLASLPAGGAGLTAAQAQNLLDALTILRELRAHLGVGTP